jgi:hypothetical protein
MSLDAVKSYFSERLQSIKDYYVKDLEKMSEEDLVAGVGDTARKGIDFTYEAGFVNHRFAKRILGETPEAWPEVDWIVAPDEYRTKEAAIQYFSESMDVIIAAWEGTSADEILRVIPLTSENTSPLDLVYSCCEHNSYHNGQLNYIQQLKGDMSVPWK